jgi:hypothetical protein
MPQLRFTLLGEGPEDDALIHILQLVLEQPALGLLPAVDIVPLFANPKAFTERLNLTGRMVAAAENFPCDLLFVHQDADGPTARDRADGIRERAADELNRLPAVIPVVPVREMQAWLLVDEAAICRAASATHRPGALNLPRVHRIESMMDPKLALRQALERAFGGSQRQQRKSRAIQPRDVASQIADVSSLRQLPAFQAFEEDVRRVIQEQGWPERLPG